MQLFVQIDPCRAQMTKASRNKRDVGHAAISPHHVGGSPGSDQHPPHPPAFLDHPACIQTADSEKREQRLLFHVTPTAVIPASISCHPNSHWSKAAIKVTVPRPEPCLPGLQGGQGLGQTQPLRCHQRLVQPTDIPEGWSPHSAKSPSPLQGPWYPPNPPTHFQGPILMAGCWGSSPPCRVGGVPRGQEGTHSAQPLGSLTSEDSRRPPTRPPVALWAETQDDEGRAGPAPARPLHAQLSLSAEEALGTRGAAEDAPKGDGLRHAGLGVSLSFAHSPRLAPARQSRQAQLNPQKGSSGSPMGTLALAAPLSTASGRAWAAVFCSLPAPRSSFCFTPLTPAPASAFKWTKPGRGQNTEPRADAGRRLGLQPPHLEHG